MTNIIQNMAGFGNMTEKVVGEDALSMVKAEIKMYANALCEVTTSSVREILHKHLNKSIEIHQKLTDFMVDKEYYFPANIKKQINLDIEETDKFINGE